MSNFSSLKEITRHLIESSFALANGDVLFDKRHGPELVGGVLRALVWEIAMQSETEKPAESLTVASRLLSHVRRPAGLAWLGRQLQSALHLVRETSAGLASLMQTLLNSPAGDVRSRCPALRRVTLAHLTGLLSLANSSFPLRDRAALEITARWLAVISGAGRERGVREPLLDASAAAGVLVSASAGVGGLAAVLDSTVTLLELATAVSGKGAAISGTRVAPTAHDSARFFDTLCSALRQSLRNATSEMPSGPKTAARAVLDGVDGTLAPSLGLAVGMAGVRPAAPHDPDVPHTSSCVFSSVNGSEDFASILKEIAEFLTSGEIHSGDTEHFPGAIRNGTRMFSTDSSDVWEEILGCLVPIVNLVNQIDFLHPNRISARGSHQDAHGVALEETLSRNSPEMGTRPGRVMDLILAAFRNNSEGESGDGLNSLPTFAQHPDIPLKAIDAVVKASSGTKGDWGGDSSEALAFSPSLLQTVAPRGAFTGPAPNGPQGADSTGTPFQRVSEIFGNAAARKNAASGLGEGTEEAAGAPPARGPSPSLEDGLGDLAALAEHWQKVSLTDESVADMCQGRGWSVKMLLLRGLLIFAENPSLAKDVVCAARGCPRGGLRPRVLRALHAATVLSDHFQELERAWSSPPEPRCVHLRGRLSSSWGRFRSGLADARLQDCACQPAPDAAGQRVRMCVSWGPTAPHPNPNPEDMSGRNALTFAYYVEVKDVMKNVTRFAEDLRSSAHVSEGTISSILEAHLSRSPVLWSALTVALSARCDRESLHPLLALPEPAAGELCRLPGAGVYALMVSLGRNLDLRNLVYKALVPADARRVLSSLLDVVSGLSRLLPKAGHVLELLPDFLRVSEIAALLDVAGAPEAPHGGRAGTSAFGSFQSVMKMVCKEQEPVFSSSHTFIDLPRVGELLAGDRGKLHIPEDSTPFCLKLYQEILQSPNGALVWSFFKPILHGKILYTPDTPEIKRVVQKEALRNKFVRNFVESQLHIDVDKLTDKLQTYGVIFHSPSVGRTPRLPPHVTYTLRTSVSYSMRTDLVKNPFWKFHPQSLPADGFKYNYVFVPLQDMIETAIILVQTGQEAAGPAVQAQAAPYPCHSSDLFLNNVGFFFPLIMMLAWVVSVASMVRKLVYEREIRLEEVGTFGFRRPWHFPFAASYWKDVCGLVAGRPHAPRPDLLFLSGDSGVEGSSLPNGKGKQDGGPLGVTLVSVTKEYEPHRAAVRDLTFTFHRDQITALLGANGAGKTTVISMLTGLCPPTSGAILIDGRDLHTDPSVARSGLGVCLQQDVLLAGLTVLEHLLLFASVKVPQWTQRDLRQQVDRTLEDVGLMSHRHTQTRALSGGLRRRLSIGIAFLGTSRTVVLDEPTSGVDTCSRRSIWDILLKYREGRTVIFTTHHLDEAEALSDCVAVLQQGGLRVCGPPAQLTEAYGQGLSLTLTRQPSVPGADDAKDTARITSLIQTYVPHAVLKRGGERELSYAVPRGAGRARVQGLFQALEQNLCHLRLAGCGVSDTSLEEVFLMLLQDPKKQPDVAPGSGWEPQSPPPAELAPGQDGASAETLPARGGRLLLSQMCALLTRRLCHTRRAWKATLAGLLLPVLFVALAMGLFMVRPLAIDFPPLKLTPGHYERAETYFFSESEDTGLARVLLRKFADQDVLCADRHPDLTNSSSCWRAGPPPRPDDQGSCGCSTCPNGSAGAPYLATRLGHTLLKLSAFRLPEYLLVPSEKPRLGGWSFGERLPDPAPGITLYSHPYGGAFLDEDKMYATLPWMYLTSRIFSSPDMAFISYVSLNFIFGLCTMLMTTMSRLLAILSKAQNLQDVYDALKWAFAVFPQFCLGQGLIELCYNQIRHDLTRGFGVDAYASPFQMSSLGWLFVLLAAQGTVLLVLRVLLHWDLVHRSRSRRAAQGAVTSCRDADVERERVRVLQGGTGGDVLVLHDLRKSYRGLWRRSAAVRGVSVGVARGETTTFKMLSGDVAPTSGHAAVRTRTGEDVALSAAGSAGVRIGYCPQQDALDQLLTGWEHLRYYCSLRGVPTPRIPQVAGDLVRRLHLEAHVDKPVATYSGGTKRKLSTALALLGKPDLLLLDEPSSGMDPCSKRVLWKAILDEARRGCAVVLTTHSMEECEALCTRLAIMVDGSFRCLGSPQHIKSRFGGGHTVRVWLRGHGGRPHAVSRCLELCAPGVRFKVAFPFRAASLSAETDLTRGLVGSFSRLNVLLSRHCPSSWPHGTTEAAAPPARGTGGRCRLPLRVLPGPPDETAPPARLSRPGHSSLPAGFARAENRSSIAPPVFVAVAAVTVPAGLHEKRAMHGIKILLFVKPSLMQNGSLHGGHFLTWKLVTLQVSGPSPLDLSPRCARRPGHSCASATKKRHPQSPGVRQRVLVCRDF
ncbi:ATP-binding cassette sub-family A member 13 [Pteropus alecto]|uniref:ATP-binding cassette sub-family A member 13 n=1 Tax=Pteropus alecto TaxID=9402 RepID=L5KQ50_PTEAL|nr:ATP-binding cassette sub-family A member 13 [Pteropus alecto]